MFIDTHCHLTFPDYQDDMDQVVSRALSSGVTKIIVPGTDLKSSRQAIELAERYPSIYAAVGVHPQDAQGHDSGSLKEFAELVQYQKVVAVGEIGLDFYRDYSPPEKQKEVLQEFLQLAIDHALPVILHNRSAFSELLTIIKAPQFRSLTGVFHCFSESLKEAKTVLGLGYSVSFTGTVTFKKSSTTEVSLGIPLDRQLLETDGPFMAPVPYRGKRNEPAFVREIASLHAKERNLSLEQVGWTTTEHAHTLFPRLK